MLIITGEFATGSIRTTLAAVPTRLPILAGKTVAALVFAAATGVASILLSWAVTAPMFAAQGHELYYLDPTVIGPAFRTILFLMIIALIALGLGTIARSNVGGLAVMFALMQVLPLLCGVIGGSLRATIAWNLTWFFPGNGAGRAFYGYTIDMPQFDAAGHLQLNLWQGLAVLLAWLVVTSVVSIILLRRRAIR